MTKNVDVRLDERIDRQADRQTEGWTDLKEKRDCHKTGLGILDASSLRTAFAYEPHQFSRAWRFFATNLCTADHGETLPM